MLDDDGVVSRLTVGDLGHEGLAVDRRPAIAWGDLPIPSILPHRGGRARAVSRIMLLNPAAVLFKHDLPRCTYPLGIGYIAAVLLENGYDVQIVDTFAEGFETPVGIDKDDNFLRYGLPLDAVAERIRDFDPHVVGVSSIFSNQADNVHQLLAVAKHVNPRIVTAIGLGVFAQAPDHPVLALDGDGAILMRLSNLAFAGSQRPPRFAHVVLDNGAHASTGGQPSLSPGVDLAAVAAACGYAQVLDTTDPAAATSAIARAWAGDGPVFVRLRIRQGGGTPPRIGIDFPSMAARFRRAVSGRSSD